MIVEIINTSDKPITEELRDILEQYVPYHILQEQRNRIVARTNEIIYDIRCVIVKVAEGHFVVWISDWYAKPELR
jgi:hypothetical protein